jgi:hypothetical protein
VFGSRGTSSKTNPVFGTLELCKPRFSGGFIFSISLSRELASTIATTRNVSSGKYIPFHSHDAVELEETSFQSMDMNEITFVTKHVTLLIPY